MADWAPRIIDLMDRLGVTFNRTPEGFRDQRRFGGTLYRRTAFAGATTGQQLLYALDEQVRRWEVAGKVHKFEDWDFLGPILDENGRCRGCVGQDLVTMQIRAFPADALIAGHRRLRPDLRPLDQLDGLQRQRRQPAVPGRRPLRQRRVRPGASHGHPRRRQAAADQRERPRRRGPHLGAAPSRKTPARRKTSPRPSDTTSSKSAIRSTATSCPATSPRARSSRSAFSEGLSVQADRMCVYLDVTHLPRDVLDRKLAGILEIYEKFQGVDPRTDADEDLSRRPLLDGRAVVRLRGQRPAADWTSARRGTSRPTSPGCSPSANATTSSTAPTGWGPTRWWPASSAA